MALNKLAVLVLLTVAYGPSLVHSSALWACNANKEPNWAECDDLMATIDWNVGSLPEDPPGVAAGTCQSVVDKSHAFNCIIGACNVRDDGASQPLNVFSGPNYYRDINAACKPVNAGGIAPDLQGESGTYIQVFNDPDYKPASRIMGSAAAQVKPVSQILTHAEFEALAERASQAQQPGTLRPRDDPTWKQVGIALSIRTDARDQLGNPTGSGASQSWSTSEGFSQGISSSVEVGASFFDIFSASVSLSISYEYSQTYSKTLTFDPSGRCDTNQRAIPYMYPLFDRYSGIYSDNAGTTVEWYIPVAPPNNYEILVECLGGGK